MGLLFGAGALVYINNVSEGKRNVSVWYVNANLDLGVNGLAIS